MKTVEGLCNTHKKNQDMDFQSNSYALGSIFSTADGQLSAPAVTRGLLQES